MSPSTPRRWTIDDRIDDFEHRGIIAPFAVDERDLARNLAAALYFWEYQAELPARALEQTGKDRYSRELTIFDLAIIRVNMRRETGTRE